MFRFTIRDVLWLMVVVALAVGWWLELKNRGPENTKLKAENLHLVKELDVAKWQLEEGASLLKDFGIEISYRGYAVDASDGKVRLSSVKESDREQFRVFRP